MTWPRKIFSCRTVRSLRGYRSAVEHLKLHEPIVFGALNESTVRGWFVQGSYKELTPKTIQALKRGRCFYKPESSGRKSTLQNFPNITKELVETFQALRSSGNLYVCTSNSVCDCSHDVLFQEPHSTSSVSAPS